MSLLKVLDSEIKATLPSQILRVTNCLAFLLLVAVNVAAQTSIWGRSDLEIAAKFPTPLSPAAWAFTIWGAIFSLQAVGVAYQAAPHGYGFDGMKQRYVNGIGLGWQLTWFAEMAWQLLFQMETGLGMLLCLACLIAAFAAMSRTLNNMYRLKQEHGSLSNVLMYVAFFLPCSIHTAWLCYWLGLAALMTPKALDYSAHLEGMAACIAVLVTASGVWLVHRFRDSAYGLTIVWALVAVYGEQQGSSFIRIVLLVAISVTTLASILSMLRRKSVSGQTELTDARQPLSRDRNSTV